MSVEAILGVLEARGLTVYLRPDGTPAVRGPKGEATPALLEALAAYKDELLPLLEVTAPSAAAEPAAPAVTDEQAAKPPSPRRVVLLAEDGSVERVFDGIDPREHHGEVRRLAREHPGRTVAAEWLLVRRDGSREWQRFLTAAWPLQGGAAHEA